MTTEKIEVDYVADLKDGESPLKLNHNVFSKPSTAQEARVEEKRKKFAKETIDITLAEDTLGVNGEKGDVSWKVQRFRLTPDFLQKLINRLPEKGKRGCTVAYLRHVEDGDIITPEEVRRLCKATPACYQMVLYEPNKTKDVKKEKDTKYQGQMKFMIRNVPQYSQNGLYEVKKNDVRNWINEGILDDEPQIIKLKNQIRKHQKKIGQLVNRMCKIAIEDVFDRHGKVLIGKKADEERDAKFRRLTRDKDVSRMEREKSIVLLQKSRQQKLNEINIVLVLQHTNEISQRNTWSAIFLGSKKDYYGDLIVQKGNWKTCLMYAGLETKDDIQADALFVSEENSEERSRHLVDIGGITVERVKHGIGFFHKVTFDVPKKWYDYGLHVDAYYGTYKEGIRSGHGVVYTSSGVYGGKVEDNLPCGGGVMVFKDGDVIKGNFDVNLVDQKSRCDSNPYARGLPHGKTVINFSDGAIYEGGVKHGQITGQGIYISATGERMEGDFLKGSLLKGEIVKNSGEVMKGRFKYGILNGEGIQTSHSKRSVYRGYFVDGEKHGKGEEVYHNRDGSLTNTYRGFFLNGTRSGEGRLEFYDTGFDHDENKISRLYMNAPWLAGQSKAGGEITKAKSTIFLPTTDKLLSKYRWLYKLKKVEQGKEKKIHEKNVREHDMSLQFRTIVERKKKNIFEMHHDYLIQLFSGQTTTTNNDSKDSSYHNNGFELKDEESSKLPSKSKFFTRQKINTGPKSQKEAKETPGLRSYICGPDDCKPEIVFRNIVKSLESNLLEEGITLDDDDDEMINNIRNEYDLVGEKWMMIDVDQIRGKLLQNYVEAR